MAAPPPVGAQQTRRVGRLRSTASMQAARAAHTATALAAGDVLICGGFTGSESETAEAELFDSRAEKFKPVGQPHESRHSHTATRLTDGRVLIAGGIAADNSYLATAELFDPSTKTFRAAGRMTMARAGHEATLLDDGRVLLAGGVGTGWTFLATAEIFDPRTGGFSATGSMREARESHVAVKMRDGRVLIAGGHRGRRAAAIISRTSEIFDPASGRFQDSAQMGVRRHKHDGIALEDGRVFIAGGADERDNEGVYSSAEVFDPATARFRAAPGMRLGRYKHRGTIFVLSSGRLLLAGGATQAEEYDPATGESEVVGGSSRLAGQFSATAWLPEERVLITGGYGNGTGPRSSAWIYEPAGSR
ncbi:MAG TPA: kelch repeat-containing protein [Bryobacteraceae bacterium]|nr:kelch repeat-containing protein [Bryobacteraceae bacterium]